MAEDVLAELDLALEDVGLLPAKARGQLLGYLLRWGLFEAAACCLERLRTLNPSLVSLTDSLARTYIGMGRAQQAVALMRRRNAEQHSIPSRILEGEAYLAVGDLDAAGQIARQLVKRSPEAVMAWSYYGDVRLAAGDWAGTEEAIRCREALRPEASATAHLRARMWQARGDADQALLWARTAVAWADRDGRPPPVDLLRLLEALYRATGQAAQAAATARLVAERRSGEMAQLRATLAAARASGIPRRARTLTHQEPASPPHPPQPSRGQRRPALPTAPAAGPRPAEAATAVQGALTLTPDERARLDEALRHHFGHAAFRPGQADVLAAILRGESVLAVMPTGAGKSLCYQLAATLLPQTTLVISPLISLMKDQLDGLPDGLAERTTLINSSLEGHVLEERLRAAAHGGYKLIYAAPERLRQVPFLDALKRVGVSLLVVDEAHCVSLWGQDFRPDYLFIAKAWQELGRPPILAVTATATPRVRDDIQAALGKMRLIATDIHRPNLRLEVHKFTTGSQKQGALLTLCGKMEGSGIVYAMSRLRCEELAALLTAAGESAIHYHAGVEDRAAAQDRFMSGRARIVVATIAFGMGIDKEDVRFVIHYDPPKALENYYQEAGRAGRDGLPARCILFHTLADFVKLRRFASQEQLSLDWLRTAHEAIRQRLGGAGPGLVAAADLERDLRAEETRVRVAIQFLETAGLLWRGFDLPRTVTLTLLVEPNGKGQEFAGFVKAARLRRNQTVSRDTVALCRDAGLPLPAAEVRLLEWAEAGWLRLRGTGRDMLLALPAPPPNGWQRLAALLADYSGGQVARINQMAAYARTTSCRHGQIATYFGGRPMRNCSACDNCVGTLPEARPERRPPGPPPSGRPGGPGPEPSPTIRKEVSRPGTRGRRLAPEEPEAFDPILFETLRAWRLEQARARGVPPYFVLHNSVLQRIAARQPQTIEQLLEIKGIGSAKLDAYGADLLRIVAGRRPAPARDQE